MDSEGASIPGSLCIYCLVHLEPEEPSLSFSAMLQSTSASTDKSSTPGWCLPTHNHHLVPLSPAPTGSLPQMILPIFFFYGATFSELNRSVIGVIARDRNGLVLTSLLPQLPQVHSLEDIEALAASKALRFAAEIEIEWVVLEVDSQVLIFRLVNDSEVLPCNGLLIEDIRRCSTLFN